MKIIDLTIPLGIGTPAWPTYEPLQVKYFKRLAPNGANGQLLTHSNHLGTHLDGEIHFHTPGKDIASLDFDFLAGPGVVVDLSDAAGDYDIYTSQMIEERVEVREGDIVIIHTGYHRYGWDQPTADEVRYMVKHPGPDREFAEWCVRKKLKWLAVDCGSADHPMNTIIRNWMPRQAKGEEALYVSALRGIRKDGGWTMPPRGGNPALSDIQIRSAVDFMLAAVNELGNKPPQ